MASLSAAAAAVVVVLAGAPSGGDAVSGRSPLAGALTSARGISTGRVPAIRPPAAAAGLANAGRSSNPVPADSSAKIGEREVAFLGGEWEHVHPLPSTAAKVRVVVDQDLPLIGVGWTPDLDGP